MSKINKIACMLCCVQETMVPSDFILIDYFKFDINPIALRKTKNCIHFNFLRAVGLRKKQHMQTMKT